MAISAPQFPALVKPCARARRPDVKVIGLSLPNMNKPHVHEGVVQTVVVEYGRPRLPHRACRRAHGREKLAPGAAAIEAGRLGTIAIRGSEVILGPPLLFTKENIDKFDF